MISALEVFKNDALYKFKFYLLTYAKRQWFVGNGDIWVDEHNVYYLFIGMAVLQVQRPASGVNPAKSAK